MNARESENYLAISRSSTLFRYAGTKLTGARSYIFTSPGFLSILLSPYKPELSMIRSCPDRLEFKNECYYTVNQSSIHIYIYCLQVHYL
jgi:hypothetical protein